MTDNKLNIKSTRVVLPIGSSSLIVVFIVLCMAVFTAITFITAKNEEKLTQQTTQFLSKYYLANENVSRTLDDLQKMLDDGNESSSLMTYDKYAVSVNDDSIVEFEVSVDDNLTIKVKAEINQNRKLNIKSSVLYNLKTDMLIEDDFLDLYEGDGNFEGFADNFENSGG